MEEIEDAIKTKIVANKQAKTMPNIGIEMEYYYEGANDALSELLEWIVNLQDHGAEAGDRA